MKNRLISELKKHILIGFICFAYYLWVVATNLYIPCVFKLITGYKCPGCGITHMIMATFRFDFSTAFRANPLLFIALPVMGIVYIVKKVYYIQNGKKLATGNLSKFFEYLFLVLLIAFWIVRNLAISII